MSEHDVNSLLQVEVKEKTLYRITLKFDGMGYLYTDDHHPEYLRLFLEEELPTIAKYFDVTYKGEGNYGWETEYVAEFVSSKKDRLLALKHWHKNPSKYPALNELLKPISKAMNVALELDDDGYIVTYEDID